MQFATAIQNQEARTENNMKALKSSANACVDLFYNIGASRGKNIILDAASPRFLHLLKNIIQNMNRTADDSATLLQQ